jgi:hypothetical protein
VIVLTANEIPAGVTPPLIDLAGQLSGRPDCAERVSGTMRIARKAGLGRSFLNGDGEPLQLCVTSTASHVRSRMIGDPDSHLEAPGDRLRAGRLALNELIVLNRTQELAECLELAIDSWIAGEPHLFVRGVMWLAAGIGTPGIGLYLDGAVPDAWTRARVWLSRMLPDAAPALRFVDALEGNARLGSVGVEGATIEDTRVKFHWRLSRPLLLSALGLPLIGEPAFARFLRLTDPAGQGFDPASLIFSAGFSLTDGSAVDAKLDVCGCPACRNFSPAQWWECINESADAFGLRIPPVREALLAETCEAILLGLGLDRSGRQRLNLYLKPSSPNQGNRHVPASTP